MGAKEKKALKKNSKKVTSSQLSNDKESADFLVGSLWFILAEMAACFYFSFIFLVSLLSSIVCVLKPLDGGPRRKLPEQKERRNTATVLYIGRIPHGFYEKEMEGIFMYI